MVSFYLRGERKERVKSRVGQRKKWTDDGPMDHRFLEITGH